MVPPTQAPFLLAASLEDPRPWETMQSHPQAGLGFYPQDPWGPIWLTKSDRKGEWELSMSLPYTPGVLTKPLLQL